MKMISRSFVAVAAVASLATLYTPTAHAFSLLESVMGKSSKSRTKTPAIKVAPTKTSPTEIAVPGLLKTGTPEDLGPLDKRIVTWIPNAQAPGAATIRIEDPEQGKTQDFSVPGDVKFTVVKGAVGYSNGKLIIIEPDSAPKFIDAATGSPVSSEPLPNAPASLVGSEPLPNAPLSSEPMPN